MCTPFSGAPARHHGLEEKLGKNQGFAKAGPTKVLWQIAQPSLKVQILFLGSQPCDWAGKYLLSVGNLCSQFCPLQS